jgi:hypothetical protein
MILYSYSEVYGDNIEGTAAGDKRVWSEILMM